jgi:peptidoglycan/LPS O-acetylase OafA/YrhL
MGLAFWTVLLVLVLAGIGYAYGPKGVVFVLIGGTLMFAESEIRRRWGDVSANIYAAVVCALGIALYISIKRRRKP